MKNEKKSRVLNIKRFLEKHTDEQNPATMQDILDGLKAKGIPASQKSVNQDLGQLIESGMDVVCNEGHRHEYFVGERHFELPELKLLIDAVSASAFISSKKSAALIEKLKAFASRHQARELSRHLHVNRQNKTVNEQTYVTVDLLNKAIAEKKQVTFMYYEYNQQKQKMYKHNRHIYSFSPYEMLWNSDKYYTLGFSDKHGKVIAFRVDRIASPKLSDKPATPKPADFDIGQYAKSVFQMYEGAALQKVTLKCENDLMKSVIDRFGEEIETCILDGSHFEAIAEVSPSPTFYGWVFSFGGRMRITAPESAVSEYRALAEKAISQP